MTLQLKVSNMACSACVKTIIAAVTAVDPVAKVEATPKPRSSAFKRSNLKQLLRKHLQPLVIQPPSCIVNIPQP